MSMQGSTWLMEYKQRFWKSLAERFAPTPVNEQETIDRLLEHDALAHQPLTPWLLYAASTAKRGWMRLDERLLAGEVQYRVPAEAQAVMHVIYDALAAEPQALRESSPNLQPLAHCFEPVGDGISISCPRWRWRASVSVPALHVIFLERRFYIGGRDEQLPHTLLLLAAPDARTHAHLYAKLRLSLCDDRVRGALVKREKVTALAAAWKCFELQTARYDLWSSPTGSSLAAQ